MTHPSETSSREEAWVHCLPWVTDLKHSVKATADVSFVKEELIEVRVSDSL